MHCLLLIRILIISNIKQLHAYEKGNARKFFIETTGLFINSVVFL